VRLDRLEDLGRAAPAELAGGGGAELDKVGGDRFAVVHCVEGCDLGMSSCLMRGENDSVNRQY
jgi:hypothetical protein